MMISGGLVAGKLSMNDELPQLRVRLYSFLRCWVMFTNFAEMGRVRHLCVSAKSR